MSALVNRSQETEVSDQPDELPIGILRLREQWRAEGLLPLESASHPDGQAATEEYTLTEDQVLAVLGITARELYALVSEGDLDCIVPDPMAPAPASRRMFREEDIRHYLEKSKQNAVAIGRADMDAKPLERDGWREMLLLELRNLKEQQRDLTSFVYELTRALRLVRPPRKRRWYLLWLR